MSATNCLVTPGPAVSLASGAPAGAGEQVKVDLSDPHNARLADAGRLVPLRSKSRSTKSTTTEAD